MIYKIYSNNDEIENKPLFIDVIPDKRFQSRNYKWTPKSSVGITFLFISACGLSKKFHIPFTKLANKYDLENDIDNAILDVRCYFEYKNIHDRYNLLGRLLKRADQYGEFNEQIMNFFNLEMPIELIISPWKPDLYPYYN